MKNVDLLLGVPLLCNTATMNAHQMPTAWAMELLYSTVTCNWMLKMQTNRDVYLRYR